MTLVRKLQEHARSLKCETYALYLAARDARTPWYARLLVAATVAYAVSPIDLIPDFVPILGYLDDLVLVPLGIALAIKLIPAPVLEECRMRVRDEAGAPVSRLAGVVVVVLWIFLGALGIFWTYKGLVAP